MTCLAPLCLQHQIAARKEDFLAKCTHCPSMAAGKTCLEVKRYMRMQADILATGDNMYGKTKKRVQVRRSLTPGYRENNRVCVEGLRPDGGVAAEGSGGQGWTVAEA